MIKDNIEGYSLFVEVEDKELQLKNRVQVFINILEDNLYEDGSVTAKGNELAMSYYDAIPTENRQELYDACLIEMTKRGLLTNGK